MSFWHRDHVEVTPNGIQVENVREENPRFRRRYTIALDNRATMKIEYDSFLGRQCSGELTQPNGRWVTFDPGRVADKILDPVLVPIIEKFCAEIARLDRNYMANNPGEVTTEDGSKWVRQ